jgi:hypothetical protein
MRTARFAMVTSRMARTMKGLGVVRQRRAIRQQLRGTRDIVGHPHEGVKRKHPDSTHGLRRGSAP